MITLGKWVYDSRLEDFVTNDGYDYSDAWIEPSKLKYHTEIALSKSLNVYGLKIKVSTENKL
jgi:hypothetical protein